MLNSKKNTSDNQINLISLFGLEGLKGNIGLAFNYGQFNAEIKATYGPKIDVEKMFELKNICALNSNDIQKSYLSYSARAGFEGDWWSLSLGLNPTTSFAEISVKF